MQLPLRGVNGRALLRFLPFLRLGNKAPRKKAGEQAQDDGPATASKLIVPLGLAISCVAHLVFLGPALLAGGSPFNTPPAEAITVDIVTSDELSQAADGQAQAATPSSDNASGSAPLPAEPNSQAALPSPAPRPAPIALTTPQSVAPPPPFTQQEPQPPLSEPPQPAAPNDPGGMFGMPMTMPDGTLGGRTFDSQAVDRANVENDAVTAFRSQLKTCSKLPAGVAPNVRVVLRIYLNPDGTLATAVPQNPEPIKVEGVSVGGGALYQNAVAALRQCQPYKMLPPDRYQEWKMLDIAFTPQNF
jgi:hypothetical protein